MTTSMKQMSYYNILAWTRECKGRVSQTFNSARLGLLYRDKVSYGNFSCVSQFNYQKVLGPNLMSKAIIKCQTYKSLQSFLTDHSEVTQGRLWKPEWTTQCVMLCYTSIVCTFVYLWSQDRWHSHRCPRPFRSLCSTFPCSEGQEEESCTKNKHSPG